MDNKETVTNKQVTNEVKEPTIMSIPIPIFILFAEFMGYSSPLIKWAEDWCDTNGTCTPLQQKVLTIDAMSIFHKMKGKYKINQIRKFYTTYFDLGLDYMYAQLVEKQSKGKNKNEDDLPF